MGSEPRRARLAVSVVFAVCGAGFSTWAARIPAAQQRLDLDTGALALGLFGLAFGSVLALLASGPLITALGSRRCTLLGATVLCAGLPAVAFAPGTGTFIAVLTLLGMGHSLLDVAMNAHAARVEQAYRRPIFAGFHAFWNIGGLLGSGAGALLAAPRVPISVHFTAAGALLLVAVGCATSRFLPGPDPGQGTAPFALPSAALLPLGAIAFCGFLAEGTVNDWSAVLLTGEGASAQVASLGYFAFSMAMITIRLVADRLSERIDVTRCARIATLLTLAGFGLVTTVPAPAAGVLGFALIGLGVSPIVPLAWSAASRKQPESPGRALATVATCGYLGFLAGPVLVGGLATQTGLPLAVAVAGATVTIVYLLAPTLRVPPAGG